MTVWVLVIWFSMESHAALDHIGPFQTDSECMQDLWLLKFAKDGDKINGICVPVTTNG